MFEPISRIWNRESGMRRFDARGGVNLSLFAKEGVTLFLALLICFACFAMPARAQSELPKPDVTRFGNRFFYDFPDEAESAITEVWSSGDQMERLSWATPDKVYKRQDPAPETRCFRVRLVPADESAHSPSPWSDWHAYSDANPHDDPALCEPKPVTRNQKRGSSPEPAYQRPPVPPICASADDDVEALPMGSIACVFRRCQAGEAIVQVYEIDAQTSQGFHQLTVMSSQLAALDGEQIVAISNDGRVLAVVWADGCITIKVGPDHEAKILHLTIETLCGPALEQIVTYGDAPGLPFINQTLPHRIGPAPAPVPKRSALPDCMVTTKYILNLRDAPAGNVELHLPQNVTLTAFEREADWFYVDYHGARGWIHADYVSTEGSCG